MTTRSTQRTSAPSGPVHRGFRPDIQGLRAVAVLVVISDHLFGWPSGGFVGVDVFFVISGFLITGLMVREHERTGRISWIGFYRRRVKRIMPAATVVLLFTVACAYILYRASRFWGVAADAFWSFGPCRLRSSSTSCGRSSSSRSWASSEGNGAAVEGQ